jgi:hypothetical protein
MLSKMTHIRMCVAATFLVVLTVAISAQEGGFSLLSGSFGSAGGVSDNGSITITGQLGAGFETGELTNGDVRILAGTLTGRLSPVKVGDFDGDGMTGFSDFLVFAGAFGTRTGEDGFLTAADLDKSGDVGFSDFLIFAGAFGQ